MPIYEYKCKCGTLFERHLPVDKYQEPQTCECGNVAEKQISRILMARVMPDISYESPITGQPITSYAQRREDMARADCVEYDPGMRTDYTSRCAREEADLEKKMDETVNRTIAQMPAKKREQLTSELEGGADADTIRITPDQKSGISGI